MLKTLLIGSYTTPETAGIRRVEVDTDAGEIRLLENVPGIGNPIYFAVDAARSRLYAAQGASPEAGRGSDGTLAAYALDDDFRPRLLCARSFPFTIPCHVSLDRERSRLFFAEYAKAYAGYIPLDANGAFADGAAMAHHEGHGPNAKRQEAAHCHCAVASPNGRTLFVCDLGTDTVNAYDLVAPGLAPIPDADFHCAPGLGPRHLVFDASGSRAYVVYELGSAVQPFAFREGRLNPIQEPLSMLPKGFDGETKAAAIRISPDGEWVLASNRGHDSIAAFRRRADGTLDPNPTISPLTGSFPRDFDFVGGTDCVIVGHKLSDNVGLYRFDASSGALSRLPGTLETPRPLAFIQR